MSTQAILSSIDERDYTLETVGLQVLEDLPDIYNNPLQGKIDVLQQWLSSQCVSHALATTVAYCEAFNGLAPNNYSRGWSYMLEKTSQDDSNGCTLRDVLKQAKNIGLVAWDEFKYGNSNCYELWDIYQKNYDRLVELSESHKILNYFKLSNIEEAKSCIIQRGACMFSYPIYKGTAGVFGMNKQIKVPEESATKNGRHCVTCIGWNESNWILQDSYGCLRSIFYIPFDYCDFSELECRGITVDTATDRYEVASIADRLPSLIKYGFEYIGLEIKRFIHCLSKLGDS